MILQVFLPSFFIIFTNPNPPRQIPVRFCHVSGAAYFVNPDAIQGICGEVPRHAPSPGSCRQRFRRALCRFIDASSVRLGLPGRRFGGGYPKGPGEIRQDALQANFESLGLFGHLQDGRALHPSRQEAAWRLFAGSEEESLPALYLKAMRFLCVLARGCVRRSVSPSVWSRFLTK